MEQKDLKGSRIYYPMETSYIALACRTVVLSASLAARLRKQGQTQRQAPRLCPDWERGKLALEGSISQFLTE